MSEFKGTPKPWHLDIPKFKGRWTGFNTMQGECYGIYATNDDLEAIACVPKDNMLFHSTQNHLANAQLIAAAPDLLEALQAAKTELEMYIPITYVKVLDKIDAALRKALGK